MIDQEVLDFIANGSNGRLIGEEGITNLQSDIRRTQWMYDGSLEILNKILEGDMSEESEKLRADNRKALETQIKEINEEIQQVQDALQRRVK
jgi:hypothetical protein